MIQHRPDMASRSWLFAPANNVRRAEKAVASAADAVILDLEDAVPIDEKVEARAALRPLLERGPHPSLFVRINALSTPYALADVEAVVCGGVRGIMLPKAETARDVQILDWLIAQHEEKASLPLGSLEIVPLVESAAGLNALNAICRSSPRVRQLAFGAADFTLDLSIAWSADEHELLPYQSAMVLASRAAGIRAPIDTPWIHVRDQAGMAASAGRSRAHGFQGKLCIHPDQIEAVHQAYAFSSAQIEEARRIVAAFEDAGAKVVTVDGRMIDYPVVEASRRLLQETALRDVPQPGGQ